MDMISYDVLSLVVRESFMQKCMQLSTRNRYPLHPNRRDVKELQVRIQKNFNLDRCLEHSTAQRGRPYCGIGKTYPISKAMRYGMLNLHFFGSISSNRAIESTENVDYKGFCFSPISRGALLSMSLNQINCASQNILISNP